MRYLRIYNGKTLVALLPLQKLELRQKMELIEQRD